MFQVSALRNRLTLPGQKNRIAIKLFDLSGFTTVAVPAWQLWSQVLLTKVYERRLLPVLCKGYDEHEGVAKHNNI